MFDKHVYVKKYPRSCGYRIWKKLLVFGCSFGEEFGLNLPHLWAILRMRLASVVAGSICYIVASYPLWTFLVMTLLSAIYSTLCTLYLYNFSHSTVLYSRLQSIHVYRKYSKQ